MRFLGGKGGYFEKLSNGSKTSGYDFRSCRWGDERTVKRAQTVSEDPHRRERNYISIVRAL
jgi:hypothetical protein